MVLVLLGDTVRVTRSVLGGKVRAANLLLVNRRLVRTLDSGPLILVYTVSTLLTISGRVLISSSGGMNVDWTRNLSLHLA